MSSRSAYQTLADPFSRAEYDRMLEPGWNAARRSPSLCRTPPRHRSRNPVDRLTQGLPHGLAGHDRLDRDDRRRDRDRARDQGVGRQPVPDPVLVDGADAALRQPATGCEARFSDRVLANRFIYHFRDPKRGDIVVFETPPAAQERCGAGGTFVKRLIGLPGETRAALGGRSATSTSTASSSTSRTSARTGATPAVPRRSRCPRGSTS